MRILKSIVLILCLCLSVFIVSCSNAVRNAGKTEQAFSKKNINKYKDSDKKPIWVIGNNIIKKLNAGEFKDIEKYIDHLVAKKPYTVDGTRVLEDLYKFVSMRLYSSYMLDKWCAKEPSHYSSFIFRGIYYMNQAWKFKGTGFAYTVTPEGWRKFYEHLELAKKDLEKAYSMNAEDPSSAAFLIRVSMGLNQNEEEMETWFKRAVAADPVTYSAYALKQNYLRPKWHGTKEKDRAFADYCYNNTPPKSIIHEIMLDYIIENYKWTGNKENYYNDPFITETIDDVVQRTLKDFPDSVSVRKKLAGIERINGNLEKTVELYSEILETDPGNPDILRLRGNLYSTQHFGKYDQAEADIKMSIESDPYGPDNYRELANIARSNMNYQNAIEYLTRAIERKPKVPQLYVERGSIKRHFLRDNASALEDFKESLKLDSQLISGNLNMALCLEGMHRFEEAKKYCMKTLAILEARKPRDGVRSIPPAAVANMTRTLNAMRSRLNEAPNQFPSGAKGGTLKVDVDMPHFSGLNAGSNAVDGNNVNRAVSDLLVLDNTGKKSIVLHMNGKDTFFEGGTVLTVYFNVWKGDQSNNDYKYNGQKIVIIDGNTTITFKEVSIPNNYGLSEQTAIKTGGGPRGERAYLDKLCGPNGEKISYKRLGSCCAFETPNSPFAMLDIYEVTYEGLSEPAKVYLNMYDPPTGEFLAPADFRMISDSIKNRQIVLDHDRNFYLNRKFKYTAKKGDKLTILMSKPCESYPDQECWGVKHEKYGIGFTGAMPHLLESTAK